MAIQDDFIIDYIDRKITYVPAFVDDRPPNIYTVNEFYSHLQDVFDEPAQMDDPVPMSAQTPTQYTMINGWFIEDRVAKALYGGSIQTSGWTKSGAFGVTQMRWTDAASDPPGAGDIGEELTGGTSGATGNIMAVDTVRQVVWVRNTSAAQFQNDEAVTGTGISFSTEATRGVLSGETVWANLFSVGALQPNTEIYVGQEDDQQGGRAYHTANRHAVRIEKLDEWWDSDVDFFTGSPNLLGGAGHFDILVKVQEAGSSVDGGRLAVFARQFSQVYSHFQLTGGTGNFVVPFASTGGDLNSQQGPYTATFGSRTGDPLEVGSVLENDAATSPEGRLRAVVTAVTGGDSATGSIQYYLVGENEPLPTTDRTLKQLSNGDELRTRGALSTFFTVTSAASAVTDGPAEDKGITVSFTHTQFDVDEDGNDEEYACVVDCNNRPLIEVYQRLMFLTSRGNQDGSTPDQQDTLLPSAASADEASEFYRAVGTVVINYGSGAGTQVTEGDYVTNSGETASGVVVSGGTTGMGTTGVLVLTQTKGSFSASDVIARPGEHGTNSVTVTGTSTIAPNTASPFGAFAGGRFFFARGIFPANVPPADANNWETTDLAGFRRAPPTVRSITFAGLEPNDRAAIFEVNTPGGEDVNKNQNQVAAAGASVGGTSIPLENTVSLDVPPFGWIRIVNTNSPTLEEYRLRYSSVSGTTVTLETGAGLSGATTGSESSTVLTSTGAFTNFGDAGNIKIGMEIRNVDDGSRATVLRKIDDNSILTTPLVGGTLNTWHSGGTADDWQANVVVVALTGDDTVYFPFIDDVATTTSLAVSVKYVTNRDLIARARFSDPGIGGTRILPFQVNATFQDANLTVTAIRTPDAIAS